MGIDARMFLRYRGDKPTDEQFKLWSWDLCAAIGADKFNINRDSGRAALEFPRLYDDDKAHLVGKLYEQDGPEIVAEDGEWFIEVNLWSRFYGEGYERGDWQTIVAVGQWLEQNIGGEVWYGGDSSGVEATPFGRSEREAMVRLGLSANGRDHYARFSQGESYPTPTPCKLCVKDRGMNRYGFGQNYVAVHCNGCGKNFTSRDNGKTWQTQEKET